MRKIIVPAPLEFEQPGKGMRLYTFFDFARELLASDTRFNTTAKGAFAAERIAARMKDAGAVDWVDGCALELESTDAQLLKEVFEQPSAGYPLKPVHAAAAFLRAVENQAEVPEQK